MEEIKIVAYYLPQFHPIAENDEWWGKGFTEWTNVTKARSLYKGHHQSFLPGELGFYDLRLGDVVLQQELLASEYGIDGFCYWHYWFGAGRTILDLPIKNKLQNKNLMLPFSLAWANETWSRRWIGREREILIEQQYLGEDDYTRFFYESIPYFADDRYIKIDGKLLFSVYLPFAHKDIPKFLVLWRNLAELNGLPGFHFNAINSNRKALELGFDSFTGGAPGINEKMRANNLLNKISVKIGNVRFTDLVRNFPNKGPESYYYKDFVDSFYNESLHEKEFPVVVTGWDNTPRKKRRGTVLLDVNANLFENHLKKAITAMESNATNEKVLFIKSWNEWAEGNVLEPSALHGRALLEAVKKVKLGKRG
jgi:hypothetical protein